MERITITCRDENGDDEEIEVPFRYEICHTCEGHGTCLNRSIGEHAYTAEEFRESFDDEEAAEYFKRGGMYDVRCDTCDGSGKVKVPDTNGLTEKQRERIEEDARADAEYEAECRAERRMGC